MKQMRGRGRRGREGKGSEGNRRGSGGEGSEGKCSGGEGKGRGERACFLPKVILQFLLKSFLTPSAL